MRTRLKVTRLSDKALIETWGRASAWSARLSMLDETAREFYFAVAGFDSESAAVARVKEIARLAGVYKEGEISG